MRRIASLRTCASCEWVYRKNGDGTDCPKCGFASYGAYSVYGKAAQRYEYNQKPWLDKKTAALQAEVYAARPKKKQPTLLRIPAWRNREDQ